MRPWDFDTSSGQLRRAVEDLQVAWEEATDEWNDGVSHKFCEEYLDLIGPAIKTGLDAVGRMRQLASQIQKECES